MVLTETINFHANHVGAIRTNKDRLKQEYNVDIVITRNRFGEYQEVDIIGYSKNIKTVKQKLQEIIDIAEYEYNQYCDRKKERHWANRKKFNSNDFYTSKLNSNSCNKKKYSNPFDVLAVDEDLDQNNDYENEFPKLPNICTNQIDINTNTKISWADMSDDE